MKYALFVCLSLFVSMPCICQTSNYSLPNITLPSPEAQNFMRYGEIPVDISTGVPNISIPLYTVTSRKLQFPISASYHASGIKVGDKPSIIGLGWVLNIRGVLAITVLGAYHNDDTTYRPTYATAGAFDSARGLAGGDPEEIFADLIDLQKDSKDWQSERYYFQLPTGQSGVFRYDFLTGALLKLPYNSFKIEKFNVDSAIQFKITDDKGDAYLFGYPPGGTFNDNYRSMDLVSIISADKTDTIRFAYKTGIGNSYKETTFATVLDMGDDAYADPGYGEGMPNYNPTANLSRAFSRASSAERILDSIITQTTIVKIVSLADRTDLQSFEGRYRVSKLSIYDRFTGNLINEVDFNHSYFGSPANFNLRLRLDSINLKGNTSQLFNTYKFDYENLVQLPEMPEDDSNINGAVFIEDYWGYFNNFGGSSNIPEEMLPSEWISPFTGFSIPVPVGSGTNRNPNHDYAKAALIKSITYPTGGKTVFVFEPNSAANAYAYPGQPPSGGAVGGFRIHQIINYTDSTTVAGTKTYGYSPGYTQTISSDLFTYGQRVFKTVHTGSPPGVGDFPTWKTATYHNIYLSNSLLPLTVDHGPPVFYDTVTEYNGDTIINAGKTVYTYLWPVLTVYASSDGPRFQNQYEQDRGNYTPLLSSKTEYKHIGGQYVPAQKTINHYDTYKANYYQTGLNLVETTSYPFENWGADEGGGFADNYFTTLGHNYYDNVFDLKSTQAVDLLTKSEVTLYGTDTSEQLVSTTNYSYDTLTHLQPLEQWTINSKGDTLKTKFTYPIDYTGAAVYDSMVARNIISPVVEQSTYNNSSFLQSSKTNFYPWTTSFIAPQTVESKTLSNSSETRLRFNAYDSKGNTLSVSKENDVKMSYIWDYNNRYPIAQVVNADTGQIAYSSFEGDGKGNWSVGSGTVDSTTAVTGRKSLRLHGNISKSGLNSGTTYVVSYWTDSSTAFTVAGTMSGYPQKGKTINGWTLYVHRVTGLSTITLNVTGRVDELRLYPLGAQMTTYTYSPLVGVTSQTDVANRVTYYEYDGLQRLKRVRDQDHNILKTLDYQYQAVSGCGPNCYIEPMQTLAGTNTIGYPVGVFNVHGKLLGNAAGPATFVSLWNADTADAHVGTLAAGADSLHFKISLNTGKSVPAITGCRFYQVDLAWNQLDAVRNFNAVYVDFGDTTGMYLAKQQSDTPAVIAPHTSYKSFTYTNYFSALSSAPFTQLYLTHTYPDTTTKTITFYHNDADENSDFDNAYSPDTSLVKLKNLRGNLPQNTNGLGGSCYQQPGMTTVSGISNWNGISSIRTFEMHLGDGINGVKNISYGQDFMQNNKDLQIIDITGAADTSFKLSRLKSNWNTYFTNIQQLIFNDYQWNRENISALNNLWFIKFFSTNPSGAGVIDNIINQIEAGSAQHISYGVINITYPGMDRTSASYNAFRILKSKGWVVSINNVIE